MTRSAYALLVEEIGAAQAIPHTRDPLLHAGDERLLLHGERRNALTAERVIDLKPALGHGAERGQERHLELEKVAHCHPFMGNKRSRRARRLSRPSARSKPPSD